MNLALLEDRLEEGTRLPVSPAPRVVYVVSGRVEVASVSVGENEAWYDPDACTIEAMMPTRLWRWELRSTPTPIGDPRHTTLRLSQTVDRSAT
jgi:hypothetical protein